MNYQEAEAYIHAMTRFGSQLGLERMQRLLDRVGNPEKRLRFIHIAGTNGKGTVTQLSAAILQAAGYRVGLYVSPFVMNFRERFQINGEMMPEETLAELMERLIPILDEMAAAGDQVTEFELVTAIGFVYFAESGCDVVCTEVGLGGRFDATNVIPSPLLCFITSISYDHTAILGDTLEKIAFEKAGILKKGSLCVTYPLQAPEALGVLYEQAALVGGRVVLPNASGVEILQCDATGSVFTYDGVTYRFPLAGRHQVYNAVSVIAGMTLLSERGLPVSGEAIRRGVEEIRIPARFEVFSKEPFVVLDGAHNPEAMEGFAQTVKNLPYTPKVALMGMMADKDVDTVLGLIAPLCDAVVTVPVDNHRAMTPADLANAAAKYCKKTLPFENHREALKTALSLAGPQGAVLICGSFYMASELRPLLLSKYSENDKRIRPEF